MAWALSVNGNFSPRRYCSLQSNVVNPIPVGGFLHYRGVNRNTNSLGIFLDVYDGSGTDIIAMGSSGQVRIRIDNTLVDGTVLTPIGEILDLLIERTVTQYIITVNGTEDFRITKSVDMDPLKGMQRSNFNTWMETIQLTLNNGLFDTLNLDTSQSDRSGSTNQPVITDTIGGNDATGVNFPPFDASVWIDLGGDGPSIIVTVNTNQGQELQTVSLVQQPSAPSLLGVESTTQIQLAYQSLIETTSQLLVNNLTQEQSVVSVVLGLNSDVSVISSAQIQETTSVILSTLGSLFVDNSYQTSSVNVAVLNELFTLTCGNLVQSQLINDVVLSQSAMLVSETVRQGQTLSSVAIEQLLGIFPEDISQQQKSEIAFLGELLQGFLNANVEIGSVLSSNIDVSSVINSKIKLNEN